MVLPSCRSCALPDFLPTILAVQLWRAEPGDAVMLGCCWPLSAPESGPALSCRLDLCWCGALLQSPRGSGRRGQWPRIKGAGAWPSMGLRRCVAGALTCCMSWPRPSCHWLLICAPPALPKHACASEPDNHLGSNHESYSCTTHMLHVDRTTLICLTIHSSSSSTSIAPPHHLNSNQR